MKNIINKKIEASISRNSQPKMLNILRKKQGHTLQSLGKLSGLSPSYISRLEAGGRRLNTTILEKLASALGCDPYVLLKDDAQDYDNSSDSHVKTLPIYSVISTDVAINASGYSVIDFSQSVEKVIRITPLIGDKSSFAFYNVDMINSQKYNKGDLLFVSSAKEVEINKDVVLIGPKNEVIIGKIIEFNSVFVKIKHYSENEVKSFDRSSLQGIYSVIGIFLR